MEPKRGHGKRLLQEKALCDEKLPLPNCTSGVHCGKVERRTGAEVKKTMSSPDEHVSILLLEGDCGLTNALDW
jgi:hypothetical protein